MENPPNGLDNKRRLIVKLRKIDVTQQSYGFVKKACSENPKEGRTVVPNEITSRTIIPDSACSLDFDRIFRCDVCQMWFIDIETLFIHVDHQHEEIKLTKDLEVALLNQWQNILEVEKSIMKHVSNNKLKSAKRLLKCSLPILKGFYTSVFEPNDNIFETFIMMMRTRIKSIIRNCKVNVSENVNKVNSNIITSSGKDEDVLKKRKSRKRKHSDVKIMDSSNPTEKNISDFSSDDDMCLRDAIKLHKSNEIRVENNANDVESDVFDEVLPVIEYYLEPERENGKPLNTFERFSVCSAINDVLMEKEVNLNKLNDVVLKRYVVEMDEIVPEGVFKLSGHILTDKMNSWSEMKLSDFISKNRSKQWRKRKSKSDEDEASDDEFSNDRKSLKTVAIEFQCEICEMFFSTFEAKDEHEKLHLMHEMFWYCPVCELQFPTLLTIKSHYKEKKCKNVVIKPSAGPSKVMKFDKQSSEAPECSQCDRKFTSVARLNQHITHMHQGIAFKKNKKSIENLRIIEMKER